MKFIDFKLSQLDSLLEVMGNDINALAFVIKMEKEASGLSYTELASKVLEIDGIYKNLYGNSKDLVGEKIKKHLQAKDSIEFLQPLIEALGIHDNFKSRLHAYYYQQSKKEEVKETKVGRVSAERKKICKELYQEALKKTEDYSPPDYGEVFIEEGIIMGATELVAYEGFNVEPELYYSLLEDKKEKDKLKKFLLIMEQFPEIAEEFLRNFELDEEDRDYMNKIKIEIMR